MVILSSGGAVVADVSRSRDSLGADASPAGGGGACEDDDGCLFVPIAGVELMDLKSLAFVWAWVVLVVKKSDVQNKKMFTAITPKNKEVCLSRLLV